MKALITIMLALGIVGVAAAYDLGNQTPVKPVVIYPENVPNPERQGGDTIETAFIIPSIPFHDTGTTAGYTNDYDAVCPYSDSTSPEVVYEYTAGLSVANHDGSGLDIDLCGSSYDTKVYVYDSSLNLVACNDDFYFSGPCGVYVSKLTNVPSVVGQTYFIVIDGYGGAAGEYVLEVRPSPPGCTVACPPEGIPENEPPLKADYIDEWNGGCNTPGHPFQTLQCDYSGNRVLCGVAGWYLYGGSQYRDTDWYTLTMGPGGSIEITADAEYGTYIFELGPQDCNAVGVIQSVDVGPCSEGYMTISGYAEGAIVWFWVGAISWDTPANPFEYDYVVWFSGLWRVSRVATEPMTWSHVKALYE